MASIGLRTAKYNKIDYTTKKYAALAKESIVPVLGRLIDAKITEDKNNTTLRADDIIAEKDYSFKGGTAYRTFSSDSCASGQHRTSGHRRQQVRQGTG